MGPKHYRWLGAPRSWERQEGPSPGTSGGSTALGPLELRRLIPKMREGGFLWFCASWSVAFSYAAQVPNPEQVSPDPGNLIQSIYGQ